MAPVAQGRRSLRVGWGRRKGGVCRRLRRIWTRYSRDLPFTAARRDGAASPSSSLSSIRNSTFQPLVCRMGLEVHKYQRDGLIMWKTWVWP